MSVVESGVRENTAKRETPSQKIPWLPELPAQMAAIAQVLSGNPLTLGQLADHFSGKGAWKKRLPQLVETQVALGRAEQGEHGNFCVHHLRQINIDA